jgi:virginiamycin B lyase
LWYTDAYQSTIGRITVGGITPYDTGSFTSNVDIVAGLDGNLWFTSTSPARQITRMTLSGELTPYPIEPRVNARFHPLGELTVGSDGAIWFTDASYSSIGRITTAGLVTRFTILGYSPYGIHAGPDGAIWFGLSGVSAQLGRITPSGTSSLYGTTGIGGIAIFTFGSDLAIWFISGDKIGRYVPGSPLAGVTALKRQVLTRNVPK